MSEKQQSSGLRWSPALFLSVRKMTEKSRWWRLMLSLLRIGLLFLLVLEDFCAAAKKGKTTTSLKTVVGPLSSSSSPPQYYYRGGFRLKACNPSSQYPVQSFNQSPKIWVKYDGRHFNTSFATLRKASVRENMLHIGCNAEYPVTLLPNPLIMVDKSLTKSFEDNMETQCHSEPRPNSPCTNYTVATSIPVHLLYLSIDTQCQSYCKQVVPVTQLKVMDSKGVIYGNMTYSRRSLPPSKNITTTTRPPYMRPPPPEEDVHLHHHHHELDDGSDQNDLVQIYVSPVGSAAGKSWIIKCSTESSLTARGAALLMKLYRKEGEEEEADPFWIKEAKEYRKAGIHTIRATFNLPTEEVDYMHCLFPRLDDFPWISRHTSIHFHDPISYWECILRLCGYFLSSFIVIGGIYIIIHKWLHSNCCAKKSQLGSATTSQSQLSLRRYNSQRSIGIAPGGSGFGGHHGRGGWGEEDESGGRGGAHWGGVYNTSEVSLVDDGGGGDADDVVVDGRRMTEDKIGGEESEEEEEEHRQRIEDGMDEVDDEYSEVVVGDRGEGHRHNNDGVNIAQSYGNISCHL